MSSRQDRWFTLALADGLVRSAAGACRGLLGRGLTAILVTSFALAAQPVMAADITVSLDDSDLPGSLGGESPPILTFGAPLGATGLDISFVSDIGEPGGVTISDQFAVQITSSPLMVGVTFTSDSDAPGGLGLCPIGGCGLIEDGTFQTAVTIHWLNDAGAILETDTVKFRSDLNATVPEPATMLLLGVGLAGLLGTTRIARRRH